MPVISPGRTAFLKFEIDRGDATRKKAALQELCRLYRRGDRLNAVDSVVFERAINGMVLAEADLKVVRWCLNALARLGTKDGSSRYVVTTLKSHEEDPEIVAAAIAALAHIYRGKLDEVPQLKTVDPAIRILAAMQTTDISKLDTSGLRINIERADVEVLKLALLTVGLNRDIQNLLHPRHANGVIVKQLGQHDDRIVKQYSVWSVMENRLLTLDDLGIPFEMLEAEPPNVQAKLLQLAAEREPDTKRRHQIIHDGTFNGYPEARIGLAKGLTHTYYDGLEDLTIDWHSTEQDPTVRSLVAEHFARYSEVCRPYEQKALELYEADTGLREHILLGAEGKRLFGRVKALDASNGMGDLFVRPSDLTSMFQMPPHLKRKAPPMKVLFLAAHPDDAKRLRLDVEARELQQQLDLVKDTKQPIEVVHAWAVRANDIQREILNAKPAVLHFSGHGDTGILAFEDSAGNAFPVSGQALADLVELCPSIKCVVLNSCFSDSIAVQIAPHVDAVIGCDVSVDDKAASVFTSAFYRALAHGESVEAAFRFAKNDLALAGEDEEAKNYRIHVRP